MTAGRKAQVFAGFFVVLWAANCALSHATGRVFIREAKLAQNEEPPGPQEEQKRVRQGAGLLIMNFPLFVGLGFIVRSGEPGMGPLYWSLVILGSVYLPLLLTLFTYLLFHAPRGPRGLPGVDWDKNLEDEDDE